jgi:hypothetical protein
MTSNNKCRTCIYWEPHPDYGDNRFGFCKRVNQVEFDVFYDEETSTFTWLKMLAEDKDKGCLCEKTDEFAAMDFYECPGILMTGCDFGCIHHENKE